MVTAEMMIATPADRESEGEKDLGVGRARFGEGNGNPLQCSCLENPRDSGAWWAAVYGITQSRTRLKRLSSSSSRACLVVDDLIFLYRWNFRCW